MKDWIDKYIDHAMMVYNRDEVMMDFLHTNQQKTFVMSSNPTSENLCNVLYFIARDTYKIPITRVTVNETCTSEATVEYV